MIRSDPDLAGLTDAAAHLRPGGQHPRRPPPGSAPPSASRCATPSCTTPWSPPPRRARAAGATLGAPRSRALARPRGAGRRGQPGQPAGRHRPAGDPRLHVDVADDGVAAVEGLRGAHEYALVLMDCRMPRMDGFDATEVIRAREPAGRRVPIIAMTASALEGERERCLAGRDGRLPHQARRPDRAGGGRAALDATAGAGARQPGHPTPEPERESEPTSLGAGGPRTGPSRRPPVRRRRTRARSSTSWSRTGRASSTAPRARSPAASTTRSPRSGRRSTPATPTAAFTASHQVKGSALNLGLPRVSAVAAALEAHAHAGRTDEAEPMLVELEAEVARAVDELARLVRS